MTDVYQELFAFLDRLGETLETLTGIERQKTDAVRKDDLLTVNDCMKREQAISLSLRSMDVKREKLLAAAGMRGVPLTGLAEHCPPELRQQARETADRLRSRFHIYQSAAAVARTTLEINLHQIEKIISAEGGGDGASFTDIRA